MTKKHTEEDAVESPPDWATLTVDVACPRCGYDLRMLTTGRCPECGLRFSWREVVEAAENVKAGTWTFDCQWPDRPFTTFFRTVAWCLAPWKVWTQLPLSAVPRFGPLLLMIPATMTLIALASATADLAWHEYTKLLYIALRGQRNFSGFRWSWMVSDPLRNLATPAMLFALLWLAIQVFRQTIARYKIRQIHILRIVVYSWISVVLWDSIIEIVLTIATMPYMWRSLRPFPPAVFRAADLAPSIVLMASLGLAFSAYLRVRGGWLWAFVVAVLAAAFVAALGTALSVFWFESFWNEYWDAIADWTPFARYVQSGVQSAFLSLHGLP